MQKNLRLENVASRFGGEEFSIILRNVDAALGHSIAERIRKTIASGPIEHRGKSIPVTISIGIATLDGENFDTIEDLIHRADEHLYAAKEKGRNQTISNIAA